MKRVAPNGQKKAPVSIDTAIREGTSFTRLLGVYVHFAPPSLQLNVPFHTPVLPLISHCFFLIGIIPLDLAKSRGPLVLKLGVEHVAAAGGGDVVACCGSLLVSLFRCSWSVQAMRVRYARGGSLLSGDVCRARGRGLSLLTVPPEVAGSGTETYRAHISTLIYI